MLGRVPSSPAVDFFTPRHPCCNRQTAPSDLLETSYVRESSERGSLTSLQSDVSCCLLGPFYGAIAIPSVTRCRCRRRRRCCGHRCAGGVRQWRRATVATPGEWQCGGRRLAVANGPNIFSNASCLNMSVDCGKKDDRYCVCVLRSVTLPAPLKLRRRLTNWHSAHLHNRWNADAKSMTVNNAPMPFSHRTGDPAVHTGSAAWHSDVNHRPEMVVRSRDTAVTSSLPKWWPLSGFERWRSILPTLILNRNLSAFCTEATPFAAVNRRTANDDKC